MPLSTSAERIIRHMMDNNNFLSMSEARKKNHATEELATAGMICHGSLDGMPGYKLTVKGAKEKPVETVK